MEVSCSSEETSNNQSTTSTKSQPQDSLHLSPNSKDDDISSSLTRSSLHSSFCDDLLNQFERRLSDLGPRSKYPYLQQLERSATNGAYDHLEKEIIFEGREGIGKRDAQGTPRRMGGVGAKNGWRCRLYNDVEKGKRKCGERRCALRAGMPKKIYFETGGRSVFNSNYDTLKPV